MSREIVEQVSFQEVRYHVFDNEYIAENYDIVLGRYYDDVNKCWGNWYVDQDYLPENFTEAHLKELVKAVKLASKTYGK